MAASARVACDNSYRINSITNLVQAQHIVPVQELRTPRGTAAGQLLREHAGVAAFVGAGVGAAGDLVAIGLEGGLNLQQLIAADQTALHAEFAHQLHRVACGVKRFLVGVEVGNAALEPVVFNAGAGHQVLEGRVAVGAQGHNLLHVALKRRVVALRQELQAPAPLVPVELRAKQQRCLFVEHPLQRLERRFAVGPRLAIAHRDLCRVGEAGFKGSVGLAIDDDHLMPAFEQVPRCADADDAGAEDYGFHEGAVCDTLR